MSPARLNFTKMNLLHRNSAQFQRDVYWDEIARTTLLGTMTSGD